VKRQVFPNVTLDKGAEMGRFNMGSTVILLLENPEMAWAVGLNADMPLRLGQKLADLS
jgi:phosphatidylserine decarboxylase